METPLRNGGTKTRITFVLIRKETIAISSSWRGEKKHSFQRKNAHFLTPCSQHVMLARKKDAVMTQISFFIFSLKLIE